MAEDSREIEMMKLFRSKALLSEVLKMITNEKFREKCVDTRDRHTSSTKLNLTLFCNAFSVFRYYLSFAYRIALFRKAVFLITKITTHNVTIL